MADKLNITQLVNKHNSFIKRAEVSERYYLNSNDIKTSGALSPYMNKDEATMNPLKLADNRISHNWHNLLVNQKVGYLLTYPPLFDIGDEGESEKVSQILGDNLPSVGGRVGVDASNSGVGWIHYWWGKDTPFTYSNVSPKQIIPVYSDRLIPKLEKLIRAYTYQNENGGYEQRCEIWDDRTVSYYVGQAASPQDYLPFGAFGGASSVERHGMGAVPFIPFYNNNTHTPDLIMYKDLIDAYDKVVSGFNNDIDDVQEVIFVIKNYGGVEQEEFVGDLKKFKTIKVDGDGGVDTIRAEIPHEARNAFLDMIKRQIFISGQGIDPDPRQYGNTSGEALKFMYCLLEIKAGMMETEFRNGYSELVRAVCRYLGINEPEKIIQTWTRNKIQNDLEISQILSQSEGVISRRTTLKNHPYVEDAEAEMEQLEKEREPDSTYDGLGGDYHGEEE